ncbi:hypothetical protein [Enterococcus villorum]|jgi:hypothetical protein|uniref:Uncharacterized protein n=2 Tax=Enterococcus villorum TaxID=112904 RepID=A0A511J1X9_9ENTE|nr:hypothetical protein [Enterococcus villorum]EOH92670.1 hypothetical protein UAO_00361 [Enterococcus villorum ATCC 700913]EOW75578.1 hypothetical protein I591_02671 [Enterococcus villorum ATCC 700913]GEL92002.1 hypothetical protein EVI01_13390 [Enterococcus villorum]
MTDKWLFKQLEEWSATANYETKALLYETKKLLLEISERKEQLQGEIDGESWNHQKW